MALLLEAINFSYLFGGVNMRNGVIAVYDSDIDYLHHLSEYLRLRDDFPYDIIVFSDLEAFKNYSLKPIDILLTSFIPNFIKEKDIGDVFFLTADDSVTHTASNDYVCLFKYQPADILLRKIMEKTGSHLSFYNESSHPLNENCKITGIYSPINRCGKTSLSISLGTILAEKESTLLISFDSFSIINDFVTDSFSETERNISDFRDISDLLFYFMEDCHSLKSKLLSLTYKFYELNYICPPVTPQRIKTTDITTWCELIKAIASSGLYRHIVFDISDSFPSSEEFFKLCNIIYMPYLTDYVSMKKMDSFLEYLSHTTTLDESLFKRITLPNSKRLQNKSDYVSWLKEVSYEHTFS